MQRGIAGTRSRKSHGLVAGLVVALLGGGCVADSGDGGIIVLKNVAADEECAVSAQENEKFIGHGSLELLVPTGYRFIAQMKSRITALAGQEDQRTIITSGAKIDIEFPGSTLFSETELAQLRTSGLTRFKSLFTAAIRPNGGLTDAGFELIPAALVRAIAEKKVVNLTTFFRVEAVATFTIEGEMSGSVVESQPFSYPVTIGTYESVNILECPLATGTAIRKGYACNPYQDGVIDCCVEQTTQGDALRCPAIAAAP